jgi:hypothetical protein
LPSNVDQCRRPVTSQSRPHPCRTPAGWDGSWSPPATEVSAREPSASGARRPPARRGNRGLGVAVSPTAGITTPPWRDGGMRFAFHGRTTSRDVAGAGLWQVFRSRLLVEPCGGRIVAEFVDGDTHRSCPWRRPPELLARRGKCRGGEHRQHRTRHPYVFRGVVHCGVCHRRMRGQLASGVADYRCRLPQEYALAKRIACAGNVYLREDFLAGPLDRGLATLFAPHRREDTIDTLMAAATGEAVGPAALRARTAIAECDARLDRSARRATPVPTPWWSAAGSLRSKPTGPAPPRTLIITATPRRSRRGGGPGSRSANSSPGSPTPSLSRRKPTRLTRRRCTDCSVSGSPHPDTQTVGVQTHVERLPWVMVRVQGPIPARATRGSRPGC